MAKTVRKQIVSKGSNTANKGENKIFQSNLARMVISAKNVGQKSHKYKEGDCVLVSTTTAY